MNKLETLTEFLINANLVAAEQIEAVVDSVQLYPACRLNTEGQLIIAEKHLNCRFFIAHYPLAQVHENELFARIAVWLINFDSDNMNPRDVDITVDMIDIYHCNLEFELHFIEPIVAVIQVDGEIIINEQRYALL